MSYNGFLPPLGRDYRYPTTPAKWTLGINNQTGIAWYIPGFDGTVNLTGSHIIDPAGNTRSFAIANDLPATSSYAWRPSSSYDVITEGGGTYVLTLSLSNSSQITSLPFDILDTGTASVTALPTDQGSTLQTTTISMTGGISSIPSSVQIGSSITSKVDLNASATASQSTTHTALSSQENSPSNAPSLNVGAAVAIAVVTTVLATLTLYLGFIYYRRHRSGGASRKIHEGTGDSMNTGDTWKSQPMIGQRSNHVYEKDAVNKPGELGRPLPHEMDAVHAIIMPNR